MSRLPDPNKLENKTIGSFLCLAIFMSTLGNVINLNAKWQIPLIFMALFSIFKIIVQIKTAQTNLSSLRYRNSSEFYSSVQRLMTAAELRVSVTYLRLVPPPGYNSAEADSYFQFGIKWAEKNPNRELRRIVGIPRDGPMREWVIKHHNETKAINNYLLRVTPFEGPVDGMNIAIIDDAIAFIALSGEGQELAGVRLESPDSVRDFRRYYDHWWDRCQTVDEHLGSNPEAPESSTNR